MKAKFLRLKRVKFSLNFSTNPKLEVPIQSLDHDMHTISELGTFFLNPKIKVRFYGSSEVEINLCFWVPGEIWVNESRF